MEIIFSNWFDEENNITVLLPVGVIKDE